MQQLLIYIQRISLVLVISTVFYSFTNKNPNLPDETKFPSLLPEKNSSNNLAIRYMDSVYNKIQLGRTGLKREVFYKAYKGYQFLLNSGALSKQELLTIVDYSQSSHNKRLYIINLSTGRLLYNTYVSHGRKSGKEFATSFSNVSNSNKSSLGFMITGNTYVGSAGFSLKLYGKEQAFNSNVYNRGVVMHGSDYVNASRAEENNLGRSYGCPAIPRSISKEIMNTIKDGSCFFVWAPDPHYIKTSTVLNAKVTWTGLKELVERENNKALAQKNNTSLKRIKSYQ